MAVSARETDRMIRQARSHLEGANGQDDATLSPDVPLPMPALPDTVDSSAWPLLPISALPMLSVAALAACSAALDALVDELRPAGASSNDDGGAGGGSGAARCTTA